MLEKGTSFSVLFGPWHVVPQDAGGEGYARGSILLTSALFVVIGIFMYIAVVEHSLYTK
jgi:hypothetical protein